jgi:hypothetical protein
MSTSSSSGDDQKSAVAQRAVNPTVSRLELVNITLSIELDFRRLAELLDRTMTIVDTADQEMVLGLKSTRNVAERGVRLARRLSKLSRKPIG